MIKLLVKRYLLIIGMITLLGWSLSFIDILMISKGGKIIDYFGNNNLYELKRNLKIFVIIVVISLFLQTFLGWLFSYIRKKFIFDSEMFIFNHLIYLKPTALLKFKTGDIVNRISKDIQSITLFFNKSYLDLVKNCSYILFSFVYICVLNKTFSTFFIIYVIFLIFVTIFFTKRVQKFYYGYYNKYAQKNAYITEVIYGLITIKSNLACKFFGSRFKSILKDTLNEGYRADLVSLLGMVLTLFVVLLFVILSFLMGLHFITKNILTLGSFISIFAVYISNSNKISNVYNSIASIRANLAGIKRLDEFIKEEREVEQLPEIRFSKKIILRNINFRYDNVEILKDLNLTVRKGEFVCITGKTGVGKSTLLSMLLGFIYPFSGDIIIDDERVDEDEMLGLRRIIGYLPQHPFILDGTLRENVEFGEKYEDSKIIEVLKRSGLEDFLNRQEGLNTVLKERGKNLSGGERQKIHLARILIKNREIYLFDEPTSNVDRKTERIILETIRELKEKGKTIILVTHREAPLKLADKIYELKDGKLKEIKGGEK